MSKGVFSKGLAVLMLAGLLAGCDNPQKTVIPADATTWKAVLDPVVDALPEGDRALLAGYLLRSQLRAGGAVTGVTVEQAIKNQKAWLKEQEKHKSAQ
ncbi:hypothetical protein [Alcaligenes sp. SDU_A2]|uniref:hypothetical protein n=1 Tax=Alcaligenes sp. SDU_A2 TaxID=3136634 RepID=UPI00311EC80E